MFRLNNHKNIQLLRNCVFQSNARKRLVSPFSMIHGKVLDGFVPTNGDFQANKAHMDALVEDLEATMKKIHQGGGEKAKAKLKLRNKLSARERIDALVDSGAPFLEVGAMAGYDMYGDWVPAGGIITGIGRING